DSGLYHYTVIRWANEHPVVPGVGNLSSTYAINNVSFLYNAMLNTGPWTDRGEHIANGLLLLMLWIHVVRAAANFIGNRGRLAENVFGLLLLPPAVMLAIAKDVASPKTDLPSGVLVLV